MSDMRTVVRQRYGEAALRAAFGEKSTCGTSCCTEVSMTDPITRDLYDAVTTAALPETAVMASLGCGNPTELDLAAVGGGFGLLFLTWRS